MISDGAKDLDVERVGGYKDSCKAQKCPLFHSLVGQAKIFDVLIG